MENGLKEAQRMGLRNLPIRKEKFRMKVHNVVIDILEIMLFELGTLTL